MAQNEMGTNGEKKVPKVTPRYDNHHFKPMAPGIGLGKKPLAKHDEQCFDQPQLLQDWHKAMFYLLEECLHSFDDPTLLRDVFKTLIERSGSFPPAQGVTPEFVMGIAKCIRSVSDIVAKDYGSYIHENEKTVSTSQMAAYHKDYARGFISKVTAVQVMHAFEKKLLLLTVMVW